MSVPSPLQGLCHRRRVSQTEFNSRSPDVRESLKLNTTERTQIYTSRDKAVTTQTNDKKIAPLISYMTVIRL